MLFPLGPWRLYILTSEQSSPARGFMSSDPIHKGPIQFEKFEDEEPVYFDSWQEAGGRSFRSVAYKRSEIEALGNGQDALKYEPIPRKKREAVTRHFAGVQLVFLEG